MEESTSSSNRRIAKNTIMLYIRMFISMIVGLYTSRIVLQTLGVEDYGIYGVVGGVVSMMGFLNASMSGATSRYITYELGKGDMQRVRDTFSSAMIIHIGIALVIILLSETIGLWFLCNKLVIPVERLTAAYWVYQFSIISAAVSITQTPYSAVIMSREKMNIYAYMELLNVSLKLGIVYLLVAGNFDKLILYSILTLAVSIIMRVLNCLYCIRNYEESRFRWVLKKDLLRPLLNFSGWHMYGRLCNTAKNQGTSFVVNMFFGVMLNASISVAVTLQGLLESLTTNIVLAVSPQIVKAYASGNKHRMEYLILFAVKVTSILLALCVIPMHICCDTIMALWLHNVPPNAVLFCRILLISSIFGCMYNPVIFSISATGNMKYVSCITGSVKLFSVVFLYILFVNGASPEMSQYMDLIVNGLSLILGIVFLKKQVPFVSSIQLSKVIIKVFAVLALAFVICNLIVSIIPNEIVKLLSSIFCSFILIVPSSYYFLLDREEKLQVISFFAKHLSR